MSASELNALVVALTALTTAVTGLILAIVKLWATVEANRRAINGRVDDLVATARTAGHAEGVLLAERLRKPEDED